MNLRHLFVGLPKKVTWQGKSVLTGIFKVEIDGPVVIRRHNIEGDAQADLEVHGGEHKAVYSYSIEHYTWWKKAFPHRDYPRGVFGENLLIEGMDESKCCVGDTFKIGTAILEAAQPRMPCFKLGVRFNDPSIVKDFMESTRWGIYYRIVEEGEVRVGDRVKKLNMHSAKVPVARLVELMSSENPDNRTIEKVLKISTLAPRIRQKLEAKMSKL